MPTLPGYLAGLTQEADEEEKGNQRSIPHNGNEAGEDGKPANPSAIPEPFIRVGSCIGSRSVAGQIAGSGEE